MKTRGIISIIFLLTLCFSLEVYACHKGGSMGYARRQPLHSTIDFSSSSTFAFASTFGTSNCKNWDASGSKKRYMMTNWEQLKEEASQGHGPHIIALSQMLRCSSTSRPLGTFLQQNYESLFQQTNPSDAASEAFLQSLNTQFCQASKNL